MVSYRKNICLVATVATTFELSPSNKSQFKDVAHLEISVPVLTPCFSFVRLFHSVFTQCFIQCSPFNVCALQERIILDINLAI